MEPITRSEQYLASIIGEEVELPVPQSRIEHYLNIIAQNGVAPSSAGLINYDPDAAYPDGSIGKEVHELDGDVSQLKSDFSHLTLKTYVDVTAQSGAQTYNVDINAEKKGNLCFKLTNVSAAAGWFTVSMYNGATKVAKDNTLKVEAGATFYVSGIHLENSVTSIGIVNSNSKDFDLIVYSEYVDQMIDTVSEYPTFVTETRRGMFVAGSKTEVSVTQTAGYYFKSGSTFKVLANDSSEWSNKAVVDYDASKIFFVSLGTSAGVDCIIYADSDDNVIGVELSRIASSIVTDFRCTVPYGCAKIYLTTNNTTNISVKTATPVYVSDVVGGAPSNVLKVFADGSGDYGSIQAAVNAAQSGDTILIYPGTYAEHVKTAGKVLHLVGVDKASCIITDDSSDYRTPPLWMGAGSVQNLTIIETHENPDPSLLEGDDTDGKDFNYQRAYTIHVEDITTCDDQDAVTLIDNCILKNTKRCCLGMGMYQGHTIIVRNCDLWTGMYDRTADVNRGVIYFHNRLDEDNDTTNQTIRFIGNTAYSETSLVLFIGDTSVTTHRDSEMECEFINNMFYSSIAGKADSTVGGSVTPSTNVTYNPDSYGNNIAKLNAT